MILPCGLRDVSMLVLVFIVHFKSAEDKILEPTILPYPNFSPLKDILVLRNATKDSGTDEEAIITLITRRSNEQRQVIMKKYFDEFNRDLLQDLRSDLSTELKEVVVNLMYPPLGFLCKELNRALGSFYKDTNTITEIVITRNSSELRDINVMYVKMFNKDLVDQMSTIRTSSTHYKSFLTSVLTGFRQAENETDPVQAKQHASLLYAAGEGRRGTSEALINKVMTHESYEQLRLVFREYKVQFGRTVEQSFKKELSGDLLRINLAIVDYIQDPIGYYTKQLYRAMWGPGTDDATLMRILISRSEIDLGAIKREFERRYELTLKSAIEGETYGYYRTALLAILGYSQA